MKNNTVSSFPATDNLSIVSAIVALGLLASRFLNIPGRSINLIVFGSPFAIMIDGQVIMIFLVVGLTFVGADMVMRNHPVFNDSHVIGPYYHCVGPVSIILLTSILTNRVQNSSIWLISVLVSIILLAFVIYMEYRSIVQSKSQYINLWLIAVYYLSLFGWFVWIENIQIRSILSSSALCVMTSLLSARVLFLLGVSPSRSMKTGFVLGILVGQVVWVGSYLVLSPIVVSTFLLLMIHFAIGLITNNDKTTKITSVVMEYGIVAMILLLIVVFVDML